jgi:hypothetical protein
LKAERVSDRDRDLPDPHGRRVREANGLQMRGIDTDHGEVGVRVVSDQLRAEPAPVAERDGERGCARTQGYPRARLAVGQD